MYHNSNFDFTQSQTQTNFTSPSVVHEKKLAKIDSFYLATFEAATFMDDEKPHQFESNSRNNESVERILPQALGNNSVGNNDALGGNYDVMARRFDPDNSQLGNVSHGEIMTTSSLFPLKLYALLNDAERHGSDSIISWTPNGKSFKVHDIDAFVSQVMPTYFRQTKYRSFQRQLNFWGFNRVSCRKLERGEYYHPQFIRGEPALCRLLSRNPKGGAKVKNLNPNGTNMVMQGHPSNVNIQDNSRLNSYDCRINLPMRDGMEDTMVMRETLNSGTTPTSTPIISILGDDQLLLNSLLHEHVSDLVSLSASQLCNVFNGEDES